MYFSVSFQVCLQRILGSISDDSLGPQEIAKNLTMRYAECTLENKFVRTTSALPTFKFYLGEALAFIALLELIIYAITC